MDKANRAAFAKALKARERVKDMRRIRIGRPVDGRTGHPVSPDTAGTIFPNRVRTPEVGQPVLMPGYNSSKLGGVVLNGTLTGARIMSLALEERATCPRSCEHWTTCYGNQSHLAARWEHGPDLEAALWCDVEKQMKSGPLLVRLHQLGDFYSSRYLGLWAALLDRFPGLYIFGFTAWKRGTAMGDDIARLRADYPDRFCIRHSGQLGDWGSATIDFPTERKRIGDAVVCPEQLDSNRDEPRGVHCGNCGVCWETERAVIFIEHGYKDRPTGKG